MKKIITLLLTSLCLFGCSTNNANLSYKKIMEEKEYTIIDVRTKEEYESGHIKGAINIPYDEINESGHIKGAINIPYDEINENTNLDKNKNIFVYCRSGSRSKTAYNALKELGYTVYDLGAYASIDLEKE